MTWTDSDMEKLYLRLRDAIRAQLTNLPTPRPTADSAEEMRANAKREREEFDSWVRLRLEQTKALRELAAQLKSLYTVPSEVHMAPGLSTIEPAAALPPILQMAEANAALVQFRTGELRKMKISELGRTWMLDKDGFAFLPEPLHKL